MEDSKIVDLYWARNEKAIEQSAIKYGRWLSSLSLSLLSSREDAEECVNDTYLAAWNSMPEARPDYLGAFLSKITRRISTDRYREKHREKRGGIDNILSELDECIPGGISPAAEYENKQIGEALNSFLYAQKSEKRVMFILRYFYAKPVQEIALRMEISESKVKTTLFRMREELRILLEEQGIL